MTPPDASLHQESPARETRPGTVLGGCIVGCAGVVALVILGCFFLLRWGIRTTPLPPAGAFLTNRVGAHLVVTVDLADPKTAAFVKRLTEHSSAGGDEPAIVQSALPIRLEGVLVDGEEGVLAVSLSRYANLVRLSSLPGRFGKAKDGVERYRGARVRSGFTVVHGSLLLGSGPGVRYAIDRVLDADGGHGSPDLESLEARLGDAPVRAVATNARGELASIWSYLAQAVDLPEGGHGLPPPPVPPPGLPPPQAPPHMPGPGHGAPGAGAPGAGAPGAPGAGAPRMPGKPSSEATGQAAPEVPVESERDPDADEDKNADEDADKGMDGEDFPHPEPRLFREATGAALDAWFGSPEAGAVAGTLTLVFPPGTAAAHADELRELGARTVSALRLRGVAAGGTLDVSDSSLVVRFRLDGLAEAERGPIKIGPVEVE